VEWSLCRLLHSARLAPPCKHGSPRSQDNSRSCRIQTSVTGACVGRDTENLWWAVLQCHLPARNLLGQFRIARTTASRIFMSGTLPGLIVLAIGGSIAPPLLLLTILFLSSQRPLSNAGALALGYFTTCVVIGILGLVLFGGAESAVSTVGRVISISVGALLVVFGIRSLLNAPDPDAPPPRWMESINSMSPPRAFGLGMALFPIQIKNLAIFAACLNLIIASGLSLEGSIAALILVLVVFAIPVLVLIGLYAAVPQRASEVLGSLQAWMENNNRTITIVLCLVFGAFFLLRGLSGP
jgi:Sap, sulfolipid-1-addressing protein